MYTTFSFAFIFVKPNGSIDLVFIAGGFTRCHNTRAALLVVKLNEVLADMLQVSTKPKLLGKFPGILPPAFSEQNEYWRGFYSIIHSNIIY